MEVDPRYENIERFRKGVEWFMMECKGFISNNSIFEKMKRDNEYHSMDKVLLFDILSENFKSFFIVNKCQRN